jgi:hypothetical protein
MAVESIVSFYKSDTEISTILVVFPFWYHYLGRWTINKRDSAARNLILRYYTYPEVSDLKHREITALQFFQKLQLISDHNTFVISDLNERKNIRCAKNFTSVNRQS